MLRVDYIYIKIYDNIDSNIIIISDFIPEYLLIVEPFCDYNVSNVTNAAEQIKCAALNV